jgi:putative DNA primase/helicase
MSAEMLPYAGLNDPFKRFINNNYKIINLFEGFGMAKFQCRNSDVSSTYSLMLYHIKSVICDNDITLYNYVIGWLAFIIQKPEIKHETCLLLQGIEGCGKNKFVEIVKRVLGETLCFDTYNIDDIIGGFNSQLSGKLLVIGDELVGYAGFKKSDFIKGMLTSPNISITKKGVDTIAEKSFQRYIFTTNNDETLRISNNDRRICIIGVSSSKVCDFQYFKALTIEMDELDNIKGLFDYLNTYDLSTYDFRKAPKTALKIETINNQLDDIYHWFIDYADSHGKTRKKEFSITSKEAYDSYSDYAGRNTRRKDFNTKMVKLLKCEYKKRNMGRCYIFDIDKTNDLFMKLYDNKKIILTREHVCETENIPVIYATEDDNVTKDLFSDDDDEK